MKAVVTSSSTKRPRRAKHTFSPPRVCEGCWWERRYKELVRLHKKLQMEMLKLHGQRRGGKPPAKERQADDDRDTDVDDLVQVMARNGID